MVICVHEEDKLHIRHDQKHRRNTKIRQHASGRNRLIDPGKQQGKNNVQHQTAQNQFEAVAQRAEASLQQDAALEERVQKVLQTGLFEDFAVGRGASEDQLRHGADVLQIGLIFQMH